LCCSKPSWSCSDGAEPSTVRSNHHFDQVGLQPAIVIDFGVVMGKSGTPVVENDGGFVIAASSEKNVPLRKYPSMFLVILVHRFAISRAVSVYD
jgi:hypothetical protein